ncbi:nitroreductase family protein [Teredinibacter waterburyi]|uniref:nitroreductase family protein n=1 Tax=Teredinibacter waterburyi TaxID=1500538 RepID=UPI00165FE31D|nr:nitroreductase family protein [Teredinibacter waterburyi]
MITKNETTTLTKSDNIRTSQLPVDAQFLRRWSPRAYDNSALPKKDLMTLFEAARWAPSAYNVQPWRFIYSIRDDDNWNLFLSLLDPFNAEWAKRSGALIFLVSDTQVPNRNPPKPFPSHSFDAGAAWMQLALQAQSLGYQAHAMGGILHQKIAAALNIPERFKIEIGIAVGQMASPDILPKSLKEREQPSTRLPLEQLIFNGVFRSLKPVEVNNES